MVYVKTKMSKMPKTCAGCDYFRSRRMTPPYPTCKILNCSLENPSKKRNIYCPLVFFDEEDLNSDGQ